MNEILAVAANWWSLPLGLLITGLSLGFAPNFLLRQIVRLYPANDERRTELFAELAALPYLKRIPWVFAQLETGIVDGRRARLDRKRTAVMRAVAHAEANDWLYTQYHLAVSHVGDNDLAVRILRVSDGGVQIAFCLRATGEQLIICDVPKHHQESFNQPAQWNLRST